MFTNTPPLAERMRPHSLDSYVGQSHLVGADGVLRRALDLQTLPSIIFWGPPGVGKTTLALLIAQTLQRPFFNLSAINSGVKEIRTIIEQASALKESGKSLPILFIDEIHRFSKSQQDSLLGAVESGIITLIGATTENPSFEVISALLSRCQLYVLNELSSDDLLHLIHRALKEDEVLKTKKIQLREHDALLRVSGGDGRKLLNVLELVVQTSAKEEITITNELVLAQVQQHMALYDKSGEQHYDIISAFIKSIRGSDPNAAMYWLARMIAGGEDASFIARRLLILASEDIGNANPNALLLAKTCFDAVNVIGWPESRIILAQTVSYLASSPKSNASYEAIGKAQDLVAKTGDLSVPLHLRNAPTALMKELNYGKNYQYAHAFPGNFVEQEYLPEAIKGSTLYHPGANPAEQKLREHLKTLWKSKYGY